ncbi:hypothetical protein AV530_007089 [Patagioenas fasciata monilis]|uniref:Uncharacterized protein n=1 Tax=Patagioenas fasciata monilis TaxID=372326 RepID=A0A1V4JJD5_PATFA|nr:hypothetical protein AV530_007089 [Patagioenas fasciata monilis]
MRGFQKDAQLENEAEKHRMVMKLVPPPPVSRTIALLSPATLHLTPRNKRLLPAPSSTPYSAQPRPARKAETHIVKSKIDVTYLWLDLNMKQFLLA